MEPVRQTEGTEIFTARIGNRRNAQESSERKLINRNEINLASRTKRRSRKGKA